MVRGLETGMQCLCSGIFVIPVIWPLCWCPFLSAALTVPVSSVRLLALGSLPYVPPSSWRAGEVTCFERSQKVIYCHPSHPPREREGWAWPQSLSGHLHGLVCISGFINLRVPFPACTGGLARFRATQLWGLARRALSVAVLNAPRSVHTQKTEKKPCTLTSLYFLLIDLKLVMR